MKIRIISMFVAFFAALFCAAALLSPAVAGADESNYSTIKGTVIEQYPAEDEKGFYYETIVLTRQGNVLKYKENDKLWKGCPLELDVYTPDNVISHWTVCGVARQITIEQTAVYLLIAIAVGIIGKNL